MRVTASGPDQPPVTAEGSGPVTISFKEPKLWFPGNPYLYDLKVELLDSKGQVIDSVGSYAAIRSVGKARDAAGNMRLTVNGKPCFLFGTLDQGWWPDGLLTPPSDEAMLADLQFLKAAGFNMVRKHVKVEPDRYYYYCDKLGIAVWQDQVSSGYGAETKIPGHTPPWTRLRPDPQDGVWPAEAHEQWVLEYKRMVDHLRNHPSILIWCPFNEAWGQHQSMEIGKMAAEYDPTRLLCLASGGNFWPVGDIASEHHYPEPGFPMRDERFRDMVKVIGEMGGHGLAVEGHYRVDPQTQKPWGYGGLARSLDDWKARYQASIEQLALLRQQGISAAVYTQTTDVETEVNGLMTYDRVPKVDAAWLKQVNQKVFEVKEPEMEVGPPPVTGESKGKGTAAPAH